VWLSSSGVRIGVAAIGLHGESIVKKRYSSFGSVIVISLRRAESDCVAVDGPSPVVQQVLTSNLVHFHDLVAAINRDVGIDHVIILDPISPGSPT
jgi:hypothetical protein